MIFKKNTVKQIEIIFHVLFWIIYFIYPIIKFGDHINFSFDLQKALINIFFISSTVYALYFLFEKALKNKLLLTVLILSFILVIYLYCVINVQDCNCDIRTCFINTFVEYIFVNIFFIAFLIFKKSIRHQRALDKSEQELIKAELKGLKAQINPHFLFNTLNMLYSNALSQDENLPENILKLSDNLHYLIHEGEKNSVNLIQEVEFIKDYVALQEARLDEKNKITFLYTNDDSNQLIPPLLLIPFIENAFKFSSIAKGKKLPINISIKLVKGVLNFHVENRYDPNYKLEQAEIWKSSGIGIKNVQKRLLLLFPNNHTLNINSEGDAFKVNLEINLKSADSFTG